MIRRGVFGSVLLLSSACGDAGTGTGGETATAGPTSTTTTTTTATTTSTSGTPTTSTSGMSGTESTTQAPTTGTTAEPTTTAVATSSGEPGTTTTTGPGTTTTSEPGTTSTTEPDTTGDESSSSTTTTSGGADDPPPPPDELAGCQSCECCEPWWISWGEVPGATHYRVRWKCSINPEQVHDVGNVTMIADVCTDIEMCNGMCAFTVGYVRVEACNPDGCSAPVDIPGIPITCGGGCCC